MRLSKTQLDIVNILSNSGYIWEAAGHPYLAYVDKDNRIKSKPIHVKAFDALKLAKIIKFNEDGRWYLNG